MSQRNIGTRGRVWIAAGGVGLAGAVAAGVWLGGGSSGPERLTLSANGKSQPAATPVPGRPGTPRPVPALTPAVTPVPSPATGTPSCRPGGAWVSPLPAPRPTQPPGKPRTPLPVPAPGTPRPVPKAWPVTPRPFPKGSPRMPRPAQTPRVVPVAPKPALPCPVPTPTAPGPHR
jgi:hypothetical protein